MFAMDRCKTVQQLQDHHIRYYLARNHPIAICVRPLPLSYIFSHNVLPPFIFTLYPDRPLAHLVHLTTDR
jgi:hypothetical protein